MKLLSVTPSDKPDKKYPVLYALHGMGASYAVYSDMSPLRKALRERPMIVASFDCDRAGWYIDSPKKPGKSGPEVARLQDGHLQAEPWHASKEHREEQDRRRSEVKGR